MANDIRLQVEIESKDAQQSINKLNKTVTGFSKDATKNFSKSSQAFNVFKGSIASTAIIGAVKGITRSFTGLFNTLITDGIAAAQVQEDAINKLNVALKASGNFTEEASKDFQEYASSLQQVTRFGDEALIQNAALIASLSGLSGKTLKDATAAATDLSAALGVDLATASNLVGRAATGNIALFSRYGVVIEKGADKSETFANTLQAINKQFGGAAAGQVATFSGAVQQLSNSYGDFQEEIGQVVTENKTFIALVNTLNTAVTGLGKNVDDNTDAYKNYVSDGINIAITALGTFVLAMDTTGRAISVGIDTIQVAFRSLALGVVTPLAAVEQGLNALIERIPGLEERFGNAGNNMSNIAESLAKDINEDFKEIEDAFTVDTALSKFGQDIADFQFNVEQASNKTTEAIKANNAKQVESEVAKISTLNAIKEEEALKAQEQALLLAAAQEEATASDLEALRANQQAQLDIRKAYADKDKELVKKIQETRKKEALKGQKAEETSLKSLFDFEKNTQAGRAANFRSSLGAIQSLSASSNKTLFNIGKAAALSQATIDGIAAVQKAYASAPFPANIAIAGLVGVATAANVAKIASAKPPQFADGGIVPGSSFSGDNVPARVNSGELILNQSQQQSIAGQLSGGPIEVSINIDGREIARAVRNQVQDGFALGV